MQRYDLIIIGGGLVGAGLAAALQRSHLRIALIDARFPSNNDPRLLALNTGSCQFLENINLWSKLAAFATPIHQVHVSNQGHFGSVRLSCKDIGLPALGHVIPAFQIETALNAALENISNITTFRPATLVSLTQDNSFVSLTVMTEEGEKCLQAPVVIGADGTESTVRKQLQIKTEIFDYEQSALVTKISLQRSHHHVAYERFTANGAIAMLPLINDECATIWTADKDTIASLLALSDAEFIEKVQTEFGYRLGQLISVAQRHVYPLRMVRAENAVVGGVYLLGNSAHTMSPIAAQGFNLALYEVAALVEDINMQDGNLSALNLQKISDKSQRQQSISMGVSHRLTDAFSNRGPLTSLAMQLGMVSLDVVTPIKKRFITNIMGRTGRVPDLLLKAAKDL